MRIVRSLRLGLAAVLAAAALAPALIPASASAAPDTISVCEGVSLAGAGPCNADATPLSNTVKLVVNIISIIGGVAAVIMIIVGGMRYITSGGESGKTASAKSTIIYALVGLIVIALAQVIVGFVLGHVGK